MLSDLKLIEASVNSDLASDPIIHSPGVQNVIRAMIVAEDRRFCFHCGVDVKGIARAGLKFLSGARLEGASTIEQQFVRTARGRYEITINRKLTECLLAILVSSRHSKAIIAYSYLEIGYFGWRANGVQQAARRLGIDLLNASEVEAAALAAMLKLPMPRFPSQRYAARHTQRVEYILKNWNEVGEQNGFTF
ncbi:transglycosylase domain-containing protein [Tritonibacter mobilis]|uniref:transglycosylase domain-containing protein n=1 Tax=Tritonibacter mobilis TaxID=379347 RepID=UPI003A5BE221